MNSLSRNDRIECNGDHRWSQIHDPKTHTDYEMCVECGALRERLRRPTEVENLRARVERLLQALTDAGENLDTLERALRRQTLRTSELEAEIDRLRRLLEVVRAGEAPVRSRLWTYRWGHPC